jgi:1,2-beta-oligoglucan phosphorylase
MSEILTSASGMQAEFNASGALCRFSSAALSLALFIGNEVEGGPTNLYLRRPGKRLEWTPLLGPHSPTRFAPAAAGEALTGAGEWLGIGYTISLRFAQQSPAWFWHVRLENRDRTVQEVDLTYAQDLALAPYGAVRMNEFYVSQYLDHTALTDPTRGVVIASRQNAAVDGRYPWSLIGSLRRGDSYATDALQFYRLAARAGDPPVALLRDLPGSRLQHEHSMAIVRDATIRLPPRGQIDAGFFGCVLADHPQATSASDLQRVAVTLALPEAAPLPKTVSVDVSAPAASKSASLFSGAALLNGGELERATLQDFFGTQWRHRELTARGDLASFFCGADRHVVLRAKELEVLRPHGHLLRTGTHMTPDETGLTTTVWMSGVFNSMLTQGHVSINRMLSTTHSYLGLFRSHGQRVFIEIDGQWRLLHVPSVFEITPAACRWIYQHEKGLVEVRTAAQGSAHELALSIDVRAGEATRFLISHHVALNGDDGSIPGAVRWSQDKDGISLSAAPGGEVAARFPNGSFRIMPQPGTQFSQVGGDELLYADAQSRQQPFLVIVTAPTKSAGLRIHGALIETPVPPPLRAESADQLLPKLTSTAATTNTSSAQVAQLTDIAPWFAHNAWVHYLSPRGLEQYSGGGWGTRDVCQGPVELLLALNQTAPIRDLLLRVMRQQNPDGDWPQWFMFFERERNIRPGDSHGDIVFWPLLALAQYLLATGDAGLLHERIPFFDARSPTAGENATVWEHVQRALALMQRRVIAGTSLAAYGHGDWNDSLQPADPKLREHMCSAWTVTLHFQMLTTLADALRMIDREQEAAPLTAWAKKVQEDFQRLLIVDGVLTGYAVFDGAAGVRYLLHPSDHSTGIQYSALAMIHAILEDMLTPAQTLEHLELIDAHLSGPDGVRLFNRPMAYHGGTQRLFQRAETATFFGREIGLMYMHAHLRYAQAMAHIGATDRFFKALCQANPIGIRSLVDSATPRQSNCYYSSSDAAFADRYHASDDYERVTRGTIGLDGGWRVYSSGAGIALGLIVRRFLGLSAQAHGLSIDPVMPAALDGLRVQTRLGGHSIEVCYRIGAAGCGVQSIEFNGQTLPFNREPNPHRPGAAEVSMSSFNAALKGEQNSLQVTVG